MNTFECKCTKQVQNENEKNFIFTAQQLYHIRNHVRECKSGGGDLTRTYEFA